MKKLSELMIKMGSFFNRACLKIARAVYTKVPTLKDKSWGPFCDAGGEELRFQYDLKPGDTVFDLGGYEGQWASDVYSKFKCKIYVFEVYVPYAENIKKRFIRNDDIKVFDFGLSSQDTSTQISIDAFSTSAFKKSDKMVTINLKDIKQFLTDNNINKIDLIKINIEGGEYELLDYMIYKDLVKLVNNFQIQFHDFVPDAINRMFKLREKLSLTHSPTYQFDFIWENWKIKE